MRVTAGEDMEKRIATIISYPKSGSTWFSYCVEYLTETRVMRGFDNLHPDAISPFVFDIRYQDDGYISMIRTELIKPIIPESKIISSGNLIYLIRNPVMLYLRDEKDKWWMYKKKNTWDTFQAITDIAAFYDQWQDKKIIIKYEDLIENIGKVISEISTVLPVRKNRVKEFLNNIDIHKENCRQVYKYKMNQNLYAINDPYSYLAEKDIVLGIMDNMKKYPFVLKFWKGYYDI